MASRRVMTKARVLTQKADIIEELCLDGDEAVSQTQQS